MEVLYAACWDNMIRCLDVQEDKIVKAFVAAKEAVKCLCIFQNLIFVSGCEYSIRSFNVETGDMVEFSGHKGWVYALAVHEDRLYSGGDDKTIIIWEIAKGRMLE